MLAPNNNVNPAILSKFISAEESEREARVRDAKATLDRARAGRELRVEVDALEHGKVKAHLTAYVQELAKRGYTSPQNRGKPYSLRWLRDWMEIGTELSDAKLQPVAHLGMKWIVADIRSKRKPEIPPATGDITRGKIKVLLGDCRDRIGDIADGSLDEIACSPPYFRVRDYDQNAPLPIWDADPTCKHDWKMHRELLHEPVTSKWSDKRYAAEGLHINWGQCRKCGAVKHQLGHEREVETYVRHMIETFRLWRAKLTKTGLLVINIGDCYERKTGRLLLIPDRLALALDADDWYPINEITWAKCKERVANDENDNRQTGMGTPEKVTNRHARATERILLFANTRKYTINKAALLEPKADGKGMRQKTDLWFIGKQYERDGTHFAVMAPEVARRMVQFCPVGGTVLDPFGGVGTTGLAAQELGRSAILIEISPKFAGEAEHRLKMAETKPKENRKEPA